VCQEAWDEAEALSFAAGYEFKDRYGTVQCQKQPTDDLLGAVLATWCERNHIKYE
jgi:hypothetical protein